jgi:hypothetical protein
VFRALRYGASGAPAWLPVLLLAEAWGCPPWEIMNHPEGLKWSARYNLLVDVKNQIKKLG